MTRRIFPICFMLFLLMANLGVHVWADSGRDLKIAEKRLEITQTEIKLAQFDTNMRKVNDEIKKIKGSKFAKLMVKDLKEEAGKLLRNAEEMIGVHGDSIKNNAKLIDLKERLLKVEKGFFKKRGIKKDISKLKKDLAEVKKTKENKEKLKVQYSRLEKLALEKANLKQERDTTL